MTEALLRSSRASSPSRVARDARRARRRLQGLAHAGRADLRAGELERCPLADAELDAAVLSLVLHHGRGAGRRARRARRALRPGGRLLVIDMLPHAREEYRRRDGHVWLGFGDEQMAAWLVEAGFDRARYVPLPPDPTRRPTLFAASARAM